MSHKKFGPDRFSRFDVYWIQTNRQTDKQTDKPNSYIDIYISHPISIAKPMKCFEGTHGYPGGYKGKKLCKRIF